MGPAYGYHPEMPPEHVFVHGAGRRGTDAWPRIDAADGDFVSFTPDSAISTQVSELLSARAHARTLFVAHSIGAVPTVLAAAHLDVAGMVLVEPALYDISRGHASVERHIAIVTEARALAAAGDLRGFWMMLRPAMFGGSFRPEQWDAEQALAQRWARTALPWGHGVRERMLHGIPTLVVTGGWNDEYEQIAADLTRGGAAHEILSGHGHRPQDAPGFRELVSSFTADLRA